MCGQNENQLAFRMPTRIGHRIMSDTPFHVNIQFEYLFKFFIIDVCARSRDIWNHCGQCESLANFAANAAMAARTKFTSIFISWPGVCMCVSQGKSVKCATEICVCVHFRAQHDYVTRTYIADMVRLALPTVCTRN